MVAEGCQVKSVGAAIGGQDFYIAVGGNGLVEPCVSGVCKAGIGAGAGRDDQQCCVAQVAYVM